MAYGLEVRNNSNFIQFSTEINANYGLSNSGSFTSAGRTGSAGEEEPTATTINVSGVSSASDIIVAFRPATATGDGIYGKMNTVAGRFTIYSDYNGTIYWRVYKKSTLLSVPTSGYGITVLNSAGTGLLFSSNYPPASFATILTVNLGTSSIVTYNHSDSALPWALIAGMDLISEESYWEDNEDGDGLGTGQIAHLGVAWNSGTQLQTIDVVSEFSGILESAFKGYGFLGASKKIGILRGY